MPGLRPSSRLAGALSSALVAASLATFAQAQTDETPSIDDLNTTVEQDENVPDTDMTPKAKPGEERWRQVAGAPYPATTAAGDGTRLVEGSPTRFDTDLHTVAFRNLRNGVAGGTECEQPPERQLGADGEPEPAADYGKRVAACVRVPAIYRYTHPNNADPAWRKAKLEGAERPGYVGAVAWIPGATLRALAVGGSGSYPRREPPYGEAIDGKPCPPDRSEPYGANCDQAGRGRAWLYDPARHGDEDWHELDLQHELAQGMRGLSALAFHPGSNVEFGAAGALGQLWHWQNGRFSEKVDSKSPSAKIFHGSLLQFRVRELRFIPGEVVQAYGVTDGCCAEDRLHNYPRLLALEQNPGGGGPPRWYVRKHTYDLGNEEDVPPPEEVPRVNYEPALPDSFYALLARKNTSFTNCVSLLATPGGAPSVYRPAGERSSILLTPQNMSEDGASGHFGYGNTVQSFAVAAYGGLGTKYVAFSADSARHSAITATLTSARFVAVDGDTATTEPTLTAGDNFIQGQGATACPESTPDWSMGELRSTRVDGLGAQGLAWGTGLRPRLVGETLDVEAQPPATILEPTAGRVRPGLTDLTSGNYEPTSSDKLDAQLRSGFFKLPSYAVNALDMVGPYGEEGTGWAVGDHGAILVHTTRALADGRLAEPEPPRLRARAPKALPERAPLDERRPAPARTVGRVPGLAARTPQRLEAGRLHPAGAPDPMHLGDGGGFAEDVADMAMSRDGREGWAVGSRDRSGTRATALFRYDGASWRRCDLLGVAAQLDPDPACAALAGLRRFDFGDPGQVGQIQAARLLAIARVPLERDSDPANDDEFEAVAIGTPYRERIADRPQPVILRLRDGRWRFEDPQARQAASASANTRLELRDVAFTAPDEGWLLGQLGGDANALFRFDGERWRDCRAEAAACGDPRGRLALDDGVAVRLRGLVAAGERLYLYGERVVAQTGTGNSGSYPLIAYREDGEWHYERATGALDPAREPRAEGPLVEGPLVGALLGSDPDVGVVQSLAVTRRPDERYEGWAVGSFGPAGLSERGMLLRLDPETGRWGRFEDRGAIQDYFASRQEIDRTDQNRQLVLGGEGRYSPAFIAQRASGRMLAFNPGRERFEPLPTGRPANAGDFDVRGLPFAMAPDNQGGFWLALNNAPSHGISGQVQFQHYSATPPQPVFEETPSPVREQGAELTALAGAADGSVWLATDQGALARYDRLAGWDKLQIPGWDPGRVVTRPSRVNALAVAADGRGVAVGEGGRIAELTPTSVTLDAAAGSVCALVPALPEQAPCGTGRDLRSAAVAPDGSALVGGERLALLWRPAGDEFRAIERPLAPESATIMGISLPTPGRAYLALDNGAVFRGERAGEGFRWSALPENQNALGDTLALDAFGEPLALRAIAVDAQGHGYAVGDEGLVLERTGDAERPWRRLRTAFRDKLTALALPQGEGDGALAGGRNGVVLTLHGPTVELARPADWFNPGVLDRESHAGELTGPVVGLALLPGVEDGQAEAWAALQAHGEGTNQLLHYASDPGEPLLDPAARAEPLPDAPAERPGELRFAALGKSDCRAPTNFHCAGMEGSTEANEQLARAVADAIAARARRPGGPAFALFSGDAVDSAGHQEQQSNDRLATRAGGIKFRRFNESVSDRLTDAGVPLFAAIGGQDLSETCATHPGNPAQQCLLTTKQGPKVGTNLAWREGMRGQPEPWGARRLDADEQGEEADAGDADAGAAPGRRLRFEEVPDARRDARRHEDVAADADGDGALPRETVAAGGASTHYALDVFDPGASAAEPLARVVVVDGSLRALAAADPVQQPLETRGQQAWLERMLCRRGEATSLGERSCSRRSDQPVIVVSNAPTYSYGPGAASDTASDASALEAILLRYGVSVLVSGRLGWNGLYWATAPGVHEPCPGGAYQAEPPFPGRRFCGRGEADAPTSAAEAGAQDAAAGLASALSGLGAPALPAQAPGANPSGLLPVAVASGAGGKFGPDGRGGGSASQGYWHGHTVVRVAASGDPRATLVEQRPLVDWLSLEAAAHVLRPGQRLTLRGFAREPLATSEFEVDGQLARFNRIDSPAITHRYDLVEAEPARPYLPRKDADGRYVALDPAVATVDSQSGLVKAGRGAQERRYAVAILSVDDKAATWPLVFEPGKSFRPKPAPVIAPPLPPRAPAPAPPQIRVLGQPPVPPPATPPPPAQLPNLADLVLPAPPALPPLPPSPAAGPVNPPPPPAPPAPPVNPPAQPLALNALLGQVGVNAAPIPPNAPAVNPAPPSGSAARKEAKQRQAATAKSEEGGSDQAGVDLADSSDTVPGSQAMTRRERTRPEPSFSPLAQRRQPSAWSRAPLYTGGLALAAATLALGFSILRPTPRRRRPIIPAPAQSAVWRRRR